MLEKKQYHLLDAMPFSLKHYSSHEYVAAMADDIWKDLPIDKSRKSELKRKCLKAVLVNLWLSKRSTEYVTYARHKSYYSAIPNRYRKDFYTYVIIRGIIDGLGKMNMVESVTGFKNPEDGYGQLSKMKPTDDVSELLNEITPEMIVSVQPPELIVLKDRDSKSKLDYIDEENTIRMRRQLIEYNALRQSSEFTLSGVTDTDELIHKRFFKLFGFSKTNGIWLLRNPFMYRVFNGNFEHGGRFYNGIESQMPKELRSKLLINGKETIELDYGSMHITMLYHLENKRTSGNVYDKLSDGDPLLRQLYKIIALVSINSANLKEALKAIRRDITTDKRELLDTVKDLTDAGLSVYYNKWVKAHKPISKYFNSDIGVKLQYYDSRIAAGITEYFLRRSVPVLIVHDSFLINKVYEDELMSVMKREYLNIIKHKPNL